MELQTAQIRVRYYEMLFSPSSLVIAATALLTGPSPAALNSFTVMVYLFPGSTPVSYRIERKTASFINLALINIRTANSPPMYYKPSHHRSIRNTARDGD